MSAIFLLLVCLTYWPRKYTTRVDPYVDNSHQVWSWYDHPCRVIAFLSADTSRDLEQMSYMASHMTNLATKYEDPTPIRSWVMSYNVSHWLYHWKYVLGHCACAEPRDRWVGGQKRIHFWNPRPRFAYSLCNFGGSAMKLIKVICKNNARPCDKKRYEFHVIC